ncbi:ATP-binding protein [Pendulispora rubella]|uniref:ATP-binding protein n=1 Tax=Pendulispora rubella TaxID=2741070 RepID=A0ABZ2LIG5_9BACT
MIGPTGSGKTFTGLEILGQLIEPGQLVAVIDTERESAYVYKRLVGVPFKWVNLTVHHPEMYVAAIQAAENDGRFGGLLVDSMSHAWAGNSGALELVDQVSARSQSQNNFFAWRQVTPFHNALVNKLVACKLHLVVTMRSKMDYVVEEYYEGGKKKTNVRKIGLQPVQRDGLEYEFDVVGDMHPENNRLVISKTRCHALAGKHFVRNGVAPGKIIRGWLEDLARASPAGVPPAVDDPRPVAAVEPAALALCEQYIAQVCQATAENIMAIVREAKAALGGDKALLARFHAAYSHRYAALAQQPQVAAS